MEYIENKKFEMYYFNENEIIENKTFVKCEFDNCVLSVPFTAIPQNRTIIRNCIFRDSIIYNTCSQQKGTLENVLFENIKTTELRIVGVTFNQVILKGNFNRIMLGSFVTNGLPIYIDENNFRYPAENEMVQLEDYRRSYYENVPWAIDISKAEFSTCDLKNSIPGKLVIRNPETQALVLKEKMKEAKWKGIKHIDMILAESYLTNYQDDSIIVAPTRHKKNFPKYMEFIKILREEGIAELK